MPIINTVYKPVPQNRTFTISWEEKADMSSGWTYSDNATGLSAGDSAFDDFFGYSGVRLSTAGVETAEITQTASGGAGKLDITQLGTLTSGDNVMIKFPVRGIKMTKSGSVVTLSITDGLDRESEGFQYYAFQNTGDIDTNIDTPTAKTPLYLGAYISCLSGTTLKSLSGSTPKNYITMANSLTRSGNNGSGWTIMGFYQRMYISALYMMKYGNPNSKSVVGAGYTGGSGVTSTGGTDAQINSTYGTSGGTTQIKLFGLEDIWGNLNQWVGGMFTDGNKDMYVALHDFTTSLSTSESQYKKAGAIQNNGYNYCLSSVLGTNKGLFGPIDTISSYTYDSYYCAFNRVIVSRVGAFGGAYSGGANAGILRLDVGQNPVSSSYEIGSRLMYL